MNCPLVSSVEFNLTTLVFYYCTCALTTSQYWQVYQSDALLLCRQIVARGLLDVLREFSDNENDFISVMETVARMSEDGGRFFCPLKYFLPGC